MTIPLDAASRTRDMEFILLVDPKGSIPSWFVNFMQTDMPLDFFKAVEKHASKTKFIPPPMVKNFIDIIIKSNDP